MKKTKDESIIENIDDEIKNEILKEDKKNKKIVFAIILTIILCTLICVPLGMFIGSKLNENKKTEEHPQEEKENSTDTQQSKEDVAEDSPQNNKPENTPILDNNTDLNLGELSKTEKDVLNLYNKIYITEKDLYASTTYLLSSMSTYDIVATALRLIDQSYVVSACDFQTPRQDVTFDYINTTLNNYLPNKSIDINTIKSLSNGSSYTKAEYEIADIGIKQNGDAIQLYGSCGSVYNGEAFTRKQVEKVEEQGDYVYLYEKHAFARPSDKFDENSSFNFYKTYNRDGEIIETTNKDPNWSLYNTYKYTFKKHDNGYYFEKVEQI